MRNLYHATLTDALILKLFRDHEEDIIAYIRCRVGCRETARDLTQEGYLRLLRRRLPDLDHLRAYLYRIAERLVIDHLRHASCWAREALSEDLPCPRPAPDRVAELQELCEMLLAALMTLPPARRDVLLLRKLDGLRYSAIAERLGISEKTVQRHLVQALLHCQRRLEHPPARRWHGPRVEWHDARGGETSASRG